jgi:hypothetical protein
MECAGEDAGRDQADLSVGPFSRCVTTRAGFVESWRSTVQTSPQLSQR